MFKPVIRPYPGAYVALPDGSVCGPLRALKGEPMVAFHGFIWMADGQETDGDPCHAIVAVYPSLQAAADGQKAVAHA